MAPPYPAIRVGAGQLSARLMNEADATLAAIDARIREAAAQHVQVLVLPECAYPAYLLGSVASYRAGSHMTGEAFVQWLQRRAAETGLHIISGFVEDAGSKLYNSAVVIDSAGRELGRVRKRFLWHADRDWFAPGDTLRVIETRFGPVGVVICAEMRLPELVATLVAEGARYIAMPTCWINAARTPGRYWNPQVEFLVEARAREFGVPVICADKSGLEMPGFGYVGLSRIVRADGTLAAVAAPTGEELIAATVPLGPPRRIVVPRRWRERLLSDTSPVRSNDPDPEPMTVAAVPGALVEERSGDSMARALFEPLQQKDVRIALTPVRYEVPAEQLALFAPAFGVKAMTFPTTADVVSIGAARVGTVSGQAIRSFAAARALALEGADILMCFDMPEDPALLRTRAAENRIFLLGASDRSAVIIGPDGAILARSFPDNPIELVARIDLAEARNKKVAPRTDIFAERRPAMYRFQPAGDD